MNPLNARIAIAATSLALAASAPAAEEVADTFVSHPEAERFEQAHGMLADATGAALSGLHLNVAGQVDVRVVDDLSEWVLK